MTDTPRKDGPRTVDDIKDEWTRTGQWPPSPEPHGGWTVPRLIDYIAEAAAGPRDQHGWSAEDYERLSAVGPRLAANEIEAPDPLTYSEEYRRGWYAARPTALSEAAAGPLDDGLDVERLEAAIRAVEAEIGPAHHWHRAGEQARDIAREYAALAATTEATPSESEERS